MTIDISKLPPWAKLEVTKDSLEAFARVITLLVIASLQSSKPGDDNQILWMDDAVQFLNLAKPTIYGLLSKGKLPHYKRGRKVYFLRSELEAWLMSGKQKTMADAEQEVENYLSKRNLKK